MFKLAVTETFMLPVKVELVGPDGKKQTQSFSAQFRRPTQAEIDTLSKRFNDPEDTVKDQEIIDGWMCGWKDVFFDEGKPAEYNDENLAALLAINPTRFCIASAFVKAYFNTAAKN